MPFVVAITIDVALFERGGMQVGRIAGVPVRLHWTALLGAFVFTGFRFDAVSWLTFAGLVLAHELGHALVVKAAGAKATAIELTGYGGVCRWRGDPSPIGRAAIAWGGIWAQLVVLAAVELWLQVGGMPRDYVAYRVIHTLTISNAYMIAFNLLPIPPLDGAEAWRLPILLGRSLRGGRAGTVMPAPAGTAHDDEFEAGHRRDEVRAIVSNLLDEARKE